ncbi:hypothetical protein U1Q18_018193, partial [Sarracenia purpurea var. burkii]
HKNKKGRREKGKKKKMCYPGFALISLRDLARQQRRWYVLDRPAAVLRATAAGQAPRVAAVEAEAQGGGRCSGAGGGRLKQCVCSPTRHPGSFRCRQHHGEYVWRGGSSVIQASWSQY